VYDNNLEPANVVDALDSIAVAIHHVGNALDRIASVMEGCR
jgi:hypothetical protein